MDNLLLVIRKLIISFDKFSIDIDIICSTKREELERILAKVVETSKFKSFELDKHRSYKPGVPKSHYIFDYDSASKTKYSGKILLDILIEDSIYPKAVEKPIETKWIETESKTMVTMPSVDSITGDKLTAFAPNTVGIPYMKGKQSFAMEICKQLFDLNKLFDNVENLEVVAESFNRFAKQEIAYRKADHPSLTLEQVLNDTIDTCVILAKRGRGDETEKSNYAELQKGIVAFGTGFLMEGNFRIDDAVVASAKVAYLAAKLLTNDLTPIEYYNGEDIKPLNIENPDWNFLNRIKRMPDKSAFYYWRNVVGMLTARNE